MICCTEPIALLCISGSKSNLGGTEGHGVDHGLGGGGGGGGSDLGLRGVELKRKPFRSRLGCERNQFLVGPVPTGRETFVCLSS